MESQPGLGSLDEAARKFEAGDKDEFNGVLSGRGSSKRVAGWDVPPLARLMPTKVPLCRIGERYQAGKGIRYE